MVGILYISDLRGCPFIGRYIDALEDENIEYKIILWNRECGDGQTEELGHVIEFKYFQDTRISKEKKAKGFLKYMRFLNNQIKMHQFDKLIVLCTLTGMLAFWKLMRRYRGKFIFDIRDISFENIRLFNHLEKK
ncbi:MAG: hypothetical protein LUD44_01750 [Firmicutes bacterium]|nr:hypothetical protein [Bacillota bacterium]